MAGRTMRYTRTAARGNTSDNLYVYGTAVRRLNTVPQREEREIPREKPEVATRKHLRPVHMSAAYVVFMALAAVAALAVCLWFLQVRSDLTRHSQTVTKLQEELAELKEENTARYNAVVDSVSLQVVKDRAMNEMGMRYADSNQIITYHNPINDYVRQYEEIPKSGVLVQAK